jgi:hypothetical protein
MAKTWRRAIQKYGSLGAISFEKAFSSSMQILPESNPNVLQYGSPQISTNMWHAFLAK